MKISLKGRAPVSNDSVGFSVIVFCDLYPTFARGFFSLWRVLCKTGLVATTCFHLLGLLQPPPGPLLPPLSAPLLSSFLLHRVCTSGGPASWTAPKNSQSFPWIFLLPFSASRVTLDIYYQHVQNLWFEKHDWIMWNASGPFRISHDLWFAYIDPVVVPSSTCSTCNIVLIRVAANGFTWHRGHNGHNCRNGH